MPSPLQCRQERTRRSMFHIRNEVEEERAGLMEARDGALLSGLPDHRPRAEKVPGARQLIGAARGQGNDVPEPGAPGFDLDRELLAGFEQCDPGPAVADLPVDLDVIAERAASLSEDLIRGFRGFPPTLEKPHRVRRCGMILGPERGTDPDWPVRCVAADEGHSASRRRD